MSGVVRDYLLEQRTREDSLLTEQAAVAVAPFFASASPEGISIMLEENAGNMDGRLMLIDQDGKVQYDTLREMSGCRVQIDEVRRRTDQRRDDAGGKAPRQRVPEAAAALSGRHDDEEVRKRSGARCVGTRTRGDEVRHRIHGLAPRVERLDLSHGRPKPAPPAPSGCRARPP